MTRRPPGASTRHSSFSVSRGLSANSSECTISTRSIELSGSGNSSSKISAVEDAEPIGQFTAPCPAGMKAKVRSVSARKRSR
jgi:hypothetical protein